MSVFVYVEKFRPNFSSLSFEIQNHTVANKKAPVERRNLRERKNGIYRKHGTALIKGFT